jgi:alpha-glucoside transport system permease protein
VTSAAPRVEYPLEDGTLEQPKPPWHRGLLLPLFFLGPALFFLIVWLVWPTIYTVWRSFYSDAGGEFVGLENYERLFTDDTIYKAITNNALWVLIVPAAVTAVGLVLAVLTERIRWATAFKVVIFMPLAVSLFAVGVIWRIMYQQDPDRGAINAFIVGVQEAFSEGGVVTQAQPSTETLTGDSETQIRTAEPVSPGDVTLMALTAIPAEEIPEDAPAARQPEPLSGGITGVVWRDFKPGGGGERGQVDEGEAALVGVKVNLLESGAGGSVMSTETGEDGTFAFEDVESGLYTLAIDEETFAEPFQGFNWLGPKLITPAIMWAYIWVTAGFALVIIAAGLAAIPRDVLEAARTDGGSEWQIFRRVTVPLLAPVLTVVFVTQIIGVLKIFDLIYAIAPGSSADDATVIAFEMWRRSFSGQNQFGLGSAIATFLFLLFIPFLILNIRRFRSEAR